MTTEIPADTEEADVVPDSQSLSLSSFSENADFLSLDIEQLTPDSTSGDPEIVESQRTIPESQIVILYFQVIFHFLKISQSGSSKRVSVRRRLRCEKYKTSSLDSFTDEIPAAPCQPLNVSEIDIPDTLQSLELATLNNCQTLKFYYLDLYEDCYKHPGVVHLFGKVNNSQTDSWFSCCVTIKNIERRIWILPREQDQATGSLVTFQQVYDEICQLMDRQRIREFRVKKVEKRFWRREKDKPLEGEYLELRYPFSNSALPPETVGRTFSKIYGYSSTAQELFLLENSIKGPRFLEIINPGDVNVLIGRDNSNWHHVMGQNGCRTVNDNNRQLFWPLFHVRPRAIWKENPDIPLNGSVRSKKWPQVHRQLTSLPETAAGGGLNCDEASTTVEIVPNERSLLNCFLMKIRKFDPDIVIAHDLISYEIPNLLHRMRSTKVLNWFCFGRLKNTGQIPASSHFKAVIHEVTAGRLYCDTKIMAKEFMHAKGYTLQQIAGQLLYESEWNTENVQDCYKTSDALLDLTKMVVFEASLVWRICKKLACLSLTAEIARIVGGVWSNTLLGGRSERSEFLLLHAFNEQNFIYPDKCPSRKNKQNDDANAEEVYSMKKKAAYSGGLVLEPKRGLYDRIILLLDFNSLYPSIIQEFNICFTTVPLQNGVDTSTENENEIPDISSVSKDLGILPVEIHKLVQSRKQVKSLMNGKNVPADVMQQYNIRQQALKITANSIYGCLGFTASRFYAKSLAALITSKGREILIDTRTLVEKLGYDVIYGDTDSIMINSNQYHFEVALDLGRKIKQEVNKRYKLLELDIDGIYKKLLLLKKKKYAGLAASRLPDGTWVERKEVKGLDIVRRDCYVLDLIMSEQPLDDIVNKIHAYLTQLAVDIKENRLPLEKYEIYKQLTRRPQDYADSKSQPHVVVALRMNSRGHHFQAGDIVKYIICEDSTNNPATQRAYYRSEFDDNPKLKIDVIYYLSQQIHPVVSRLCDPIDETDAGWLSCDEIACNYRCRTLPVRFDFKGRPHCPKCEQGTLILEYSQQALYLQLRYLQHIFDVSAATSKLSEKDRGKSGANGIDQFFKFKLFQQLSLLRKIVFTYTHPLNTV
ncbi:unnamed protein product [Soboliphyme baturini]|uniref:DNA polymerase n=1 Tax=Soboliphyme baturini TaxID=241478 RepID=A0A183IIY3_9BILA|nr:unnamed protein product [Soboliphyme baturini]